VAQLVLSVPTKSLNPLLDKEISVIAGRIALMAFVLTSVTLPARAQEQTTSDLRARITELEQQMRELAERLSGLTPRAADAPNGDATQREGRRGISAATLETNALQLAGSWVLTGEAASSRAVTPKNAFDRATGKWGAFEVTARHHQLTPDKDAFPLFANVQTAAERARAWTGCLIGI
jgi:hypothetical protein